MFSHRAFLRSVAGTLLLSLAILSRPLLSQGPAPVDGIAPAAVVNGEAIPHSEVKALLDSRTPPVPQTYAQRNELRKAAVELLVDDAIMRQFLNKNAPQVNATDVDREMAKLKETLTKDNKKLEDFLREGHQSVEQLRRDLTARAQWRAYLSIRFTDAELRAYYQNNKPFFDKTFVQASHILARAGQIPAERQKAREKLEVLRQEIMTGKISFEEAASKYSDCPSKDKKGDVGQFPYKFVVVEPFAKAAFSLKKGEISGIVSTDFGMHLIKVTNRVEGEPTTYEAVRDTVREVYAQDLELFQKVLAEQRKIADIKIPTSVQGATSQTP